MSTVVSENRSPAFLPLALATLMLALTGAFTLISAISTPADAYEPISRGVRTVQWLSSNAALIGFALVLSSVLVERRGVPPRAWVTIVSALIVIFALGLAWSLAQNKLIVSFQGGVSGKALMVWMALLSAAKVVIVNLIALPLAWRLGGGRGDTPVTWRPWQRRVLGALVAASFCAGVALLVQWVATSFTALGDGDSNQHVGMSVVAIGVGLVHGLFALILPMRRGSGAVPAMVSSLLTPVLIIIASLPAIAGGEGWDMAGRIAVVMLILLFAPMLSWLVVRWLHGRGGRG